MKKSWWKIRCNFLLNLFNYRINIFTWLWSLISLWKIKLLKIIKISLQNWLATENLVIFYLIWQNIILWWIFINFTILNVIIRTKSFFKCKTWIFLIRLITLHKTCKIMRLLNWFINLWPNNYILWFIRFFWFIFDFIEMI